MSSDREVIEIFFNASMSGLRTVFVPLGGHTVTMGKLAEDIGRVVEVEMNGDSSQDEKELCIKIPATRKPQKTTPIQKI